MLKIVNNIIDEWDPIELFPLAPKDEYLDESQAICNSYKAEMTAKELAQIIHQVFSKSFGIDTFTKSISECEVIAVEIVKEIM